MKNKYVINKYRFKEINNLYLVTTECGTYCKLNSEEFLALKKGSKFSNELYEKLKNKLIVIDKDNYKSAIDKLNKKKSFLDQSTSLHIIVLTLRCNQSCIYCSANTKLHNSKSYDMDYNTAQKTVEFIFSTPSPAITIEFQGGECLLNLNVLKYIVDYALRLNKSYKKDLKIVMVSNFLDMDESILEFLIDRNVQVCTSLDGPKELHNSNRPYKNNDSYEKVIFWIKRFNEEYKKRKIESKANALVTLTKKSLDYHKEIIDEYVNLNLNSISLRFLSFLGNAKDTYSQIGYTSDEFLDFWYKSVDYIQHLNKSNISCISERHVGIITNKLTSDFEDGYLDLRNPCGAVIGQLAYNYDGSIYPCDEARMIKGKRFKIGDVFQNNYRQVLFNPCSKEVISASITEKYACNNCVYKPFCGVCPICNYSETGDLSCSIYSTNRCKIYKAQFDWVVNNKL